MKSPWLALIGGGLLIVCVILIFNRSGWVLARDRKTEIMMMYLVDGDSGENLGLHRGFDLSVESDRQIEDGIRRFLLASSEFGDGLEKAVIEKSGVVVGSVEFDVKAFDVDAILNEIRHKLSSAFPK